MEVEVPILLGQHRLQVYLTVKVCFEVLLKFIRLGTVLSNLEVIFTCISCRVGSGYDMEAPDSTFQVQASPKLKAVSPDFE